MSSSPRPAPPSLLRRFFALYRWDRPFLRRVLMIALPLLLQDLVSSTMHIVDSLMVSGLGDTAYVGVTQGGRYTFLFQLFLFGACTGTGIFMSQFWGARDVRRVRGAMGVGMLCALVIAALFIAVAVCFPRQVVLCFLPDGPSAEFAREYLVTVLPSYVFFAVSNVYAVCHRSCERTYIPMSAGIVSILVNTLGNWLLIYGNLGAPKLGVRGAAIATIIASFSSMTLNVAFAYGKRLPAGAPLRSFFGLERAFYPRYFKTVLPVILNEGLWAAGISMYSAFFGRMGDQAIAAYGIFQTLDGFVYTAIYAMMNASSVVVGKALGAGERDNALLYAKRMMQIMMTFGLVMGLTVILLRAPMVNIFSGISLASRDAAERIIAVSGLFMAIRSFNSVNVVGILRAGGDTLYSLLLDVGAMWTVGVPLVGAAALLWHLPVEIVYLCTMSEEILKMVIGLPHFFKGTWMHVLTRKEESV